MMHVTLLNWSERRRDHGRRYFPGVAIQTDNFAPWVECSTAPHSSTAMWLWAWQKIGAVRRHQRG